MYITSKVKLMMLLLTGSDAESAEFWNNPTIPRARLVNRPRVKELIHLTNSSKYPVDII